MLYQVEFLGRTEAFGPLLSSVYFAHEWKLASVHSQPTDDWMAGLRNDESTRRKSGNLRSGRDSQPGHGEEAYEGYDDRTGFLHDHFLRVSVLVCRANHQVLDGS